MSEILEQIASPAWWFTVVFATLTINLVTPLLRASIAKGAGSIAAKVRESNAKARTKWLGDVRDMSNSDDLLWLAGQSEIRCRMRAYFHLAFAFLPVILSGSNIHVMVRFVVAIMALFALALSTIDLREAIKLKMQIYEAIEMRAHKQKQGAISPK